MHPVSSRRGNHKLMFGYLERQMFKAVPGGYIFQPPPPTRFHGTQAYVVNEAQKEEIEVISRRGRIFSGCELLPSRR
jgi:hypothetical protein